MKHMETLIKWYPIHIEKEDKDFFISSLDYLNEEEQSAMLKKSKEFDMDFTQLRYAEIVKELESRKN